MARDVYGLSEASTELTDGQAASETRQVEVGSAFRVTELGHGAVNTRNHIIAATSHYLAKLYAAGQVCENDIVKFFSNNANKQ